MYLAWFCLSGVNSCVGGRFQSPHWAPVAIVRSHHRRGCEPCTGYYKQWFLTKIHVFKLVMLVRRQFKGWGSISNITLGPNGHDSKPPSSSLGTLYSPCRQLFMTEINVLRPILLTRHQFKCSGLVCNTTLGPSGHGTKPPSSTLGTLYSWQWFMTKIHVLRLVLFVRRQFKRWGRFQTPYWAPVAMY